MAPRSGMSRFRLSAAALVLAVVGLGSPAFAQEGYVLDAFGGVHAFGGAPVISPSSPYFGFDVAAAIELVDSAGFIVLDKFGGVHAGGTASTPSPLPPYFGFEAARDLALVPASSGSPIVVASPGTFVNVNGSDTKFQSLFGTSFSGSQIGGENLFPVACSAGNLVARTNTNTTPGTPRVMVGSEAVTVTVVINEVATALACTVSVGQSGCTAAGTVSVSAGDRVGYKLDYSNVDTAGNGIFYIHKGFTCS